MFGSDPDERLGPLSQDILWALIEATEPEESFSREQAVTVIREANDAHPERLWSEGPPDMASEIEEILWDLENRGYLYEASDGLRVTDRDIFD